jgi:hypothetical protein
MDAIFFALMFATIVVAVRRGGASPASLGRAASAMRASDYDV